MPYSQHHPCNKAQATFYMDDVRCNAWTLFAHWIRSHALKGVGLFVVEDAHIDAEDVATGLQAHAHNTVDGTMIFAIGQTTVLRIDCLVAFLNDRMNTTRDGPINGCHPQLCAFGNLDLCYLIKGPRYCLI